MSLRDVLTAIALECDRQETLKREGQFRYHTGDHEMTNPERLAVLAEEFGEVARAILELGNLANDRHGAGDAAELRKELIQVAAVCAKWVEGMDRRAALTEYTTEAEKRWNAMARVGPVADAVLSDRGLYSSLLHVIPDRGNPGGLPPALDGEGVDQGREQRAEHASDDAEAGARGLLDGDENDDADQRREREDGDDENAE